MKPLFSKVVYFLLIVGFGLFIWTYLPNARIEETYSLNTNSSLFSNKNQCDNVQELMEAKYKVTYPKIIRYDEFDEILVNIEKPSLSKSYINNNYLSSCGISLEAWIDGKGMLIKPGNRIIEPFSNKLTQNFRFEIFPAKDHLNKGTIWINAIFPRDYDAVFERIPMFAIPFIIQSQSLIGIPARIVRLLSISLALLAVLSLIFQKDQNKNRK
jgi:hypothetical protein